MTTTTDTAELVAKLRAACVGHPAAAIPWPHRILHEAADRLTALERERDEAREKAGKLHDYANMRDWQILDLREALKPFAQEKMPSLKMSEIAYNSFGLRCLMSPMAIARQKAIAALRREGPSAAEAALTASQAEVERLKIELEAADRFGGGWFSPLVSEDVKEGYRLLVRERAALQPQVGK